MKCIDCFAEFQATGKGGRCLSCRREWDRVWRARRKAAGNPVISTKMPAEYHAAYGQAYIARPGIREKKAAAMRVYSKVPELAIRHAARRAVRTAIKAGRMTRKPCEVCGANRTHGHHDDYTQPLNVRWLCPSHHREHHAKAEGRS